MIEETDGLPTIPKRGDQVRALFLLPAEERTERRSTVALPVVVLELTDAGLWWSPADDTPMAEFTPWHGIEGLTQFPDR